jgi:hypothetical protein
MMNDEKAKILLFDLHVKYEILAAGGDGTNE